MEFFIGLAIVAILWVIFKVNSYKDKVVDTPVVYKRPEEPIEDKVETKLIETDQI